MPELPDFPLTGTWDIGGLHLTWDFTDLAREKKAMKPVVVLPNGRVCMPFIGIY